MNLTRKLWIAPLWRQLWTVSAVLISMVSQGMVLGYTTSLLPALQAQDSPIKVDLEMSSWLMASIGISCSFGFIYSSYIMNVYGRRIAYIMDSIPQIVGLILIYYASDFSDLIIGRLLCGATVGATSILGAIIIGEYTSPKYRCMFLNLETTAVFVGTTIVHLLGHYFNWRIIAIINLMPTLASVAITCTWPESPAWLASNKEFGECERNFIWLRGEDVAARNELNELIKSQQVDKANLGFLLQVMEFGMKFTKKELLKPITIFFFAVILLETSGRHVFPAYATEIVNDITGSDKYSMYYTLYLDMIITLSASFSTALIKIMKLRTLLFSTGAASVFVLLIVCTYLFLTSNGIILNIPWIPIVLFGLYLVLINIGCAPIPLTLIGTIFPLAHRGVGTTLAGMFVSLTMVASLKIIPLSLASIKVYGTFTVLALVMVFSLLVLFFILPETKDRTLQEIENYFYDDSFGDDDEYLEEMIDSNKTVIV
ncbi:hypothetical protein K1T71_013406 [Dendrolimus kikuchii]|uniref:Uncharacterized protein n=1 Tax=Dendrolimus kikuchii TaxID=765133 RepID=A0ACC1CIA6_9NEOP|nr:hypothetical protein K1T71_013406 [Dendrolimus kikuchii]